MIGELHAALLQGIVTLGTAAVCWSLYARYRRRDLLWWSVAWSLYVLRIGAIIAFLSTQQSLWLFVHQVLTGGTALVLLWAALTYSRAQRWRPAYALALLFPLAWSYLAIYQLQSFMLAAVPAVLFLSFATFWTGLIFLGEWRLTRSHGAAILAGVLFTWALHHLDYPILRARGAWNPWGYYLDILFVLATVIGIVLLALEQLDQRTVDLQRMSARMLTQHEEERRRISLELHDQSAQVWAAVRMQLGLLREQAAPGEAARLDRVLDLVDRGITSIRSVTTSIRPPLLDDLGLAAALRSLVQSFANESGLAIAITLPATLPRVSDDVGLALFRALQEALSNVARHSRATSAQVRVDATNGTLTLTVRDNGRGVVIAHPEAPLAARGLGLSGMRERIAALRGSVELESQPAQGATLTVRVPVAS